MVSRLPPPTVARFSPRTVQRNLFYPTGSFSTTCRLASSIPTHSAKRPSSLSQARDLLLPFVSKVPTHHHPIFTTVMMSLLARVSVICLFLSLALTQHDHGDDMGMGSGVGGAMKMYLHFTSGDSVLFGPWVPQTDRAMFGTCVGVFLLAMIDRWFSATAAVMNAYWDKKVARAPPNELKAILSSLPSFVPEYDIPRGIATLGTKSVHFTLMLIVMTQNASFIISIILGLGFGEMLFGRYATHLS